MAGLNTQGTKPRITRPRGTGPAIGDPPVDVPPIDAESAPTTGRPVSGWLIFLVGFVPLLTLLLVRSRELFVKVIYEEGDAAANSILAYQAKHFDLLVGNYSRVGFSHPGPAFFYLQGFGEWLLYDVTHLVPSPWNGQAVAILTGNAALLSLVMVVLYGWFRSWAGLAAGAGVVLAFLAAHDDLVSSTWMPFVYVAPFLLLLVAAASVAAGRLDHLWLLALAGGLLVHGHAEFLFFVPLLVGLALWPVRRELLHHRRHWLTALAVLAPFLLPILLNQVLHWPGELPKYVGYGGRRGVHAPWDAAGYLLQFWAGNRLVAIAMLAGLLGAVAVVGRGLPQHPLLRAGARTVGAATVLFFVYASYGIDHLRETYVGYFFRAAPLALLVLGAVGLVARFDPRPRMLAGVALFSIGLVLASQSAALVNRRGEVPGVPRALDIVGATGGRPVVLEVLPRDAWAEAVPVVVGGLRRGMRVCLRDPGLRLLVTDAYVCTADDLARGDRWQIIRRGTAPPGTEVFADLSPSVLARIP